MSAPAPLTVNTPFETNADPATPTLPTSTCCHGAGSCPVRLTFTLSKIDWFRTVLSWLVTASPRYGKRAPQQFADAENVVEPTVTHDDPSADIAPVTVEPEMASFSHTGSVDDVP